MQHLTPIAVSDLVRAAWKIRQLGKTSAADRAIWIAARHYTVDRTDTVQLSQSVVERVLELLGNPNRGYD